MNSAYVSMDWAGSKVEIITTSGARHVGKVVNVNSSVLYMDAERVQYSGKGMETINVPRHAIIDVASIESVEFLEEKVI